MAFADYFSRVKSSGAELSGQAAALAERILSYEPVGAEDIIALEPICPNCADPPDDEYELVFRYITEISKVPALDESEQQCLLRRITQGDKEAGERLTEGLLWLAAAEAMLWEGKGILPLDLIQEANIGLVRAVERWNDPDDSSLKVHLVRYIRMALKAAYSERRSSAAMAVWRHKIAPVISAYIQLKETLSRKPSVQEIAAASGHDETLVRFCMKYIEADRP